MSEHWKGFAELHDFDSRVLALAEQALNALSESELCCDCFAALAFNCNSESGALSLSLAVNPGFEDESRTSRCYPPDWDYECLEDEVEEVAAVWLTGYKPLRQAYCMLADTLEDDVAEALAAGFLHSLRRVMVQLEQTEPFRRLNAGPIWTLVTEVDADTDEEERLLAACRLAQ